MRGNAGNGCEGTRARTGTGDATSVKPWELSTEEKIAAAEEAKVAGNRNFKNGRYLDAIVEYENGVNLVKDLAIGEDEEEAGRVNQSEQDKVATAVCLSLSLNCAIARLKANVDFKEAIHNCKLALSLDSNNVKALFRMAQAYSKSGEYETAKQTLDGLLRIDPENPDAMAEKKRVDLAQVKAKKTEKAMFTKMFA